jgi:peptidyl-prolyl cis-trans isomerase B (cyclophilin B)
MRHFFSQHKAWLILIVIVGTFAAYFKWLAPRDTNWKRVPLKTPDFAKFDAEFPKATLVPGRVVVLDTSKGRVELVLFEKDCPKTTALIVRLVQQGCYDNVKFIRVEKDGIARTANCTKGIKPVASELLKGLLHEKGAVGLAKWSKPTEKSGAFYILMEPWHHLDYEYAVFGRLINGMDVVQKLRIGDVVKKATIRPLTNTDEKRLSRVLVIETERRTE